MKFDELVDLIKRSRGEAEHEDIDYMTFSASSFFNGESKNNPSEIERLFCTSFMFLTNIYNINDAPISKNDGLSDLFRIEREVSFGKYRCDFFCQYEALSKNGIKRASVVVECDSQKWHETTEKQRRYEKKRERFIQSKGFNIFRFTGKEIIEDPISCAKEVKFFLESNIKGDAS